MENAVSPAAVPATTVFFDGSCPLCRREIAVYRRLEPLGELRWADVSRPDTTLPPGLDRAAALARFHVALPGGELRSGAAAFVALWRVLPGWRWLARFASLPGVVPALEGAYRAFLRVRPRLQRLLARRDPGCVERCEAGQGGLADRAAPSARKTVTRRGLQ